MKVRQIREVLEKDFRGNPEMSIIFEALKKFDGISVSMFAGKIANMRLPKIDPDEAVTELKSVFRDSRSFEKLLSDMEKNSDYTKAVFFHVYSSLFPSRKLPAKSTRRPDLIEKIRVARRRDENYATS